MRRCACASRRSRKEVLCAARILECARDPHHRCARARARTRTADFAERSPTRSKPCFHMASTEIAPAIDRIIARIELPGARGNHRLLIEPQQRLAFIACEGNDKL